MKTSYTYCPICGKALSEKNIDGKIRAACSSEGCSFVFWNNPVPVVAALVEHSGAVLLARNKSWPEKMFGLVTGFLEGGETPADGALREVKEELGLEGEIVGLIGMYPFPEQNQIIIAYHVRAHGTITAGDEIAEVKSIPPEKVRPWPFGTGLAVGDWLKRRAAAKG